MEDAAGFIQERDDGEGPFPSRDGWKTVVFLVRDEEDAPAATERGEGQREKGGTP